MPWDPFEALRSLRRPIWVVLAAFACALQGPSFLWSLRPAPTEGVDFFQDWASAKNFWNGVPIYGTHRDSVAQYLGLQVDEDNTASKSANRVSVMFDRNAHPPTSVLMVLPLAALDYPNATLLWNLLSLAALGASLWLVGSHLGIRFQLWSIAPIVTLLLVSSPFRQQMSQGQLNLILLLLLMATWTSARSGRAVWAGTWLALATAIKLFPGFLFLHFALQKQWKIVVTGVIGLAVIMALTAMVLGASAFSEYFQYAPLAAEKYRDGWNNASLMGLFNKLFDPAEVPLRTRPLWRSPIGAKVAGFAACLMVLAFWARVVWQSRSLEERDFAFGLSITTMLLVSPITWEHYFLLLAIPLAMVWIRLPDSSRLRVLFLVILIVLSLPPVVLWDSFIPGGHRDGIATPIHTLTVNSYGCYGLLSLFVLSFIMISGGKQSLDVDERRTAASTPSTGGAYLLALIYRPRVGLEVAGSAGSGLRLPRRR